MVAVKHQRAVNKDLVCLGVDAERVIGPDDDIRHLAGLQAARTIVNAQ